MSAIYETRCPRHAAKCFTSTISAQPTLLQPAHWCLSCSLNTCFHLRAFALALLPAWSSSFRYPNGSLLHFLQISAQMSLFPTTSIKVLLPYLVHMPLPLHPHLLSVWSYCSSVTQSCPAPCDPMDCSTPGLPVHHQLLELAQTHVHWVGDAIQPSHPLSSSSPPAFSLSQHQGLFQWVDSSHQVAKSMGASASASVLPMNIQGWSPLGLTGLLSLQSKGLSRIFSNTTVRRH